MPVASIAVEELLLILKIAFVVLLYLFIWRIVRTASKDLRVPQESFILAPSQAHEMGVVRDPGPRGVGRLVVVSSPTLEPGEGRMLDSAPVTVGRGPQNDVSTATTTPRRSTPASSRAVTASGSRTSAPRTAPT